MIRVEAATIGDQKTHSIGLQSSFNYLIVRYSNYRYSNRVERYSKVFSAGVPNAGNTATGNSVEELRPRDINLPPTDAPPSTFTIDQPTDQNFRG